MVGVKTWSDDQIQFILTSKSGGMKIQEIIRQCKQRWPRKEFKDTGVRYVITNYGKDPDFQSGATSHQSQHKSHPRGQKNKRHLAKPSSSPHTNQQHIVTLQTKPSATHSPSIPQNISAAGMREVAGGPIQATLTSPQPLQILTSQVDSQARTLAHAQQAQDIGIASIVRGAKVASQSPKDKITIQQNPSLPSQNPHGGTSIHNNTLQQGQNTMSYVSPIAQHRGPFRHFFDQNGALFWSGSHNQEVRNNNPNLPNGMNGITGLHNPSCSAPHQMLPPPQPYQAQHQAVNAGTFPTQRPPHQLPTRSMQLPTQESFPIDPALSTQYPPPPPQSPQSGYQPAHMPPPQMAPYITMPQFGTRPQDWMNNMNPMGSLSASPIQVTPGQSMPPAQPLSVGIFKAASYGPPAHPVQLHSWGPNPSIPGFVNPFPPAARQFYQSGIRHDDGLPTLRPTPYVRRTSWPKQSFNIDTDDGWAWERVNGVTDPNLLALLSPSGKVLGPGIIFYGAEKDVTFYMPSWMAADIAGPSDRSTANPNIPRHSTCKVAELSLNNPLRSGPLKGSLPETRGMASSSKEQSKVDRASGRKRATTDFDKLFPPKPLPQSNSESTPFAQAPLIAPPQANLVSQPALQVAAQRGPQQEVVNQGMSAVVSYNSPVQQNVAPSMQPSPQLSSSHSMEASREANNRPTVKRKGPCSPTVNESSPPKRPRAENHNAQVGSGPPQPMQPDDTVAQFPSERTMSSNAPSGLQMPASSNVSNAFGDSMEHLEVPEIPYMSMRPQASGNINNLQFNLNPSGPLSGLYLSSPQSSQVLQQRQARYNDRKNNYLSEQTHTDDDIFAQYTDLDNVIHAENSSEQYELLPPSALGPATENSSRSSETSTTESSGSAETVTPPTDDEIHAFFEDDPDEQPPQEAYARTPRYDEKGRLITYYEEDRTRPIVYFPTGEPMEYVDACFWMKWA